MVDPVNPISATGASAAVRIDRSLSIMSEPDNALVAARQSEITAHLEALKNADARKRKQEEDAELPSHDEDHSMSRQMAEPSEDEAAAGEKEEDAERLSGESERIGSVNFDEDTPFGDRVAIL